ncbi:MAG: dTMP kinase [Kiritimatiellae bacterium]|nr:dTMP kinase [Kiritimatiellia bacterium]
MKGLFITFEGPEGCGKSTHVATLVERLREAGHEVVATREPGGTKTGELIRGILQHDAAGEPLSPEAELLLFAASRAQLVRRVIAPALERGAIVIADRFVDSTTAYQGYGRGFDIDEITTINQFAVAGTWPDITILLDTDIKEGLRRVKERGSKIDRFEKEDVNFHKRIRAGYLEMAAEWPERFRLIDSRRDPKIVADDIWNIIGDCLNRETR